MDEEPRIRKLDLGVVNKIAAGEIIVQPANALKEILENAVDAGATTVEVLVKDGGLKLLQVSDNGKGIDQDDMRLLCERFATSKLSKFEDLETIATYGFRGEALASISHIARLSVVTKTKASPLAFKAFYLNGELVAPGFKAGDSSKSTPKPIAGKDGTQIIVEDLFYNVPSRLKTLKSKSEEFSRILDVIGRYAVHTGGVGFSCKKFGESQLILSTRPQLPLKERIRSVFGTEIANETLELNIDGSEKDENDDDETHHEKYGLVSVSGAVTNANYSSKKRIAPVFFVNHRLVACEPLKRAINSIYQLFLPKGGQSFVYLSLELRPQNVDVNIHPTKSEVRFLHEEEIVAVITKKLHTVLSSVDTSRKFQAQSILGSQKRQVEQPTTTTVLKKLRQENKLVRVDALQSKLNTFLSAQTQDKYHRQMTKQLTQTQEVGSPNTAETEPPADDTVVALSGDEEPNATLVVSVSDFQYTDNGRERVEIALDSIREARIEVEATIHRPLTNIFNNCAYVGIVDEERRLCCFQHDVRLYLCDYASTLNEFYYQVALAEFGNYGDIRLLPALDLWDLLEPLYENNDGLLPREAVIENIVNMRDMFSEYFRVEIGENEEGKPTIANIPLLVKGVVPGMGKLPYFVYRLGASVDYSDEKSCLTQVMRQLALLYVPEAIGGTEKEQGEEDDYAVGLRAVQREELNHSLEHVVFPLLKQRFLATKSLLEDVVQIADLPGLYRVFERC